MRSDRVPIVLFIGVALALTVSLSILVWLHQQFESDRARSLGDMRRFFTREEVLRPPYDLNIRFGRVAALADKFEETLFARRVYVAKMIAGRGEHLVHPFYLPATNPNWKRVVADWTALPLEQGGETYGVLYVQENPAPLTAVRWAIAGLGALLLFTLALLMAWLFAQQKALVGAHVALAEKERELVKLERLALAGLLSANIIHDIKKPVANIKHHLADLESALGDMAGGSTALKKIREQTDLFFSILRDLGLEKFVRSRDQARVFADLNDILRRACALVQYERESTKIEWDLEKGASMLVHAQPYRLIQVFSNLILNAFQAMGGQGTLTLRTRLVDGRARVEVCDTGPGIAPEARQRLFEPFESTKSEEEGTGLGLYISRSIVEQLGGRLELADSEQGACFVVELPLAESDEG